MESSTHKLLTLKISANLDKNGVTDGEKTERHSMEMSKIHHTILEYKASTNTMEEGIKIREKEAQLLNTKEGAAKEAAHPNPKALTLRPPRMNDTPTSTALHLDEPPRMNVTHK